MFDKLRPGGEIDEELFERLRTCRLRIAQQTGVPAFVVFHDRTLREMATSKPTDRDEMRAIHGIGAAKLERYGDEFLRVLREHGAG